MIYILDSFKFREGDYLMSTVLVTGGAGFIGSHIVDKLIGKGYRVIVVDNLYTGKMDNVNKRAKFYKADIRDKKLYQIFETERPEFVFHQAAQINICESINNPRFDADINIIGTINMLECCRKTNVKKIIYASSAAVYGNPKYLGVDEKHRINPISYYGISKFTPEQYIKAYNELYGLKYTILRYANVYGIRQEPKGEGGVISIFLDKMLRGEKSVIYGDGKQTRDFIYVDDITRANILALKNGDNDIFNIGTSVETSINDLFQTMNRLIGNSIALYRKTREGDILHSFFDITKSKKILEWEPKYTLYAGLNETIEYYRKIFKYKNNIMANKMIENLR